MIFSKSTINLSLCDILTIFFTSCTVLASFIRFNTSIVSREFIFYDYSGFIEREINFFPVKCASRQQNTFSSPRKLLSLLFTSTKDLLFDQIGPLFYFYYLNARRLTIFVDTEFLLNCINPPGNFLPRTLSANILPIKGLNFNSPSIETEISSNYKLGPKN